MIKAMWVLNVTLILCVSSLAEESAKQGPVEIIFANREYLSSIYKACTHCDLRGNVGPYEFRNKDMLLSLVDMPRDSWNGSKRELLDGFLKSVRCLRMREENVGSLVNDDVYVEVLVSCFELRDSEFAGYWKKARRLLLYRTARRQLQRHSQEIKGRLGRPVQGMPKEDLYFYSLLDLTESEKAEVLAMKGLPLWIEARLGSARAEKRLIREYRIESEYRRKRKLVKELMFVGTRQCIENLIVHFNEPVFWSVRGCIVESIRYPILLGLRQHHPDVGLLNAELDDLIEVRRATEDTKAMTKAYLDKVKEWMSETYGVQPTDPDPEPILQGRCMSYSR